jgi:hypothetical protein
MYLYSALAGACALSIGQEGEKGNSKAGKLAKYFSVPIEYFLE